MVNTQRKEEHWQEFRGGRSESPMNPQRGGRQEAYRERTGRRQTAGPQRTGTGREKSRPRQAGGNIYRGNSQRDSRRKRQEPGRRGEADRIYTREIRVEKAVSRKRKKRRRKKASFLGGCVKLMAGIAGTVLLFSLVFKVIEEPPWLDKKPVKEYPAEMESAVSTPQKSGGMLSREVEESLKGLAKEDDRVREILENSGNYPEQLLETLANNPETLDFVLDYPEKKDTSPADTIGDVKKGTVPFLLQWDERWGYREYGGGLLACTGCGPTCLSMVIAGLTGDNSITPYTVACYAQENGYYEAGAGTKWSLMSEGAARFGIQGREISPDESAVVRELDAGHPIICSMGPGDFTRAGHFIVLTGTKDGKIQVHDPNSRIRSGKLWEFDDLRRQMRNLWAFE